MFKMDNKYIFTLFFVFEGQKVENIYHIESEDYETFYNLIQYFFSDEIDDAGFVGKLTRMFPEYAEKYAEKDDNYFCCLTLDKFFNRNFRVTGIDQIEPNMYKIEWNS